MQQYADIYLLRNHSTCFGCPQHPSSGVLKTVTAASGTGHTVKTRINCNKLTKLCVSLLTSGSNVPYPEVNKLTHTFVSLFQLILVFTV